MQIPHTYSVSQPLSYSRMSCSLQHGKGQKKGNFVHLQKIVGHSSLSKCTKTLVIYSLGNCFVEFQLLRAMTRPRRKRDRNWCTRPPFVFLLAFFALDGSETKWQALQACSRLRRLEEGRESVRACPAACMSRCMFLTHESKEALPAPNAHACLVSPIYTERDTHRDRDRDRDRDIHAYIHTYMYIYIYIHIYVYTHTHT